MTILGVVGDRPWVWRVTLRGMVGDHPWKLSPGVSFQSKMYVPNSMSVVHFLLVGDYPWVDG